MTDKKVKLLRLKGKMFAEIKVCRVDSCHKHILPKIEGEFAIYPERCPGCRSPYWNKPYSRPDML